MQINLVPIQRVKTFIFSFASTTSLRDFLRRNFTAHLTLKERIFMHRVLWEDLFSKKRNKNTLEAFVIKFHLISSFQQLDLATKTSMVLFPSKALYEIFLIQNTNKFNIMLLIKVDRCATKLKVHLFCTQTRLLEMNILCDRTYHLS